MAESPYLAGNFAPVHDERDEGPLPVQGHLPEELDGLFLRVGSNPRFEPPGAYHWFDGDGMVHAVELRDGQARYRNRWVRTRGFEVEERRGHAVWGGLFEMPQFDNPDGPRKNTANTALAWHAGRLLALWEQGEPWQLSPRDLSTIGPCDFGGALDFPFTAHPKLHPESGELHFFGYSPIARPFLHYGVIDASGRLAHRSEIELPIGVMMHDFAITRRHAIFLDCPYTFDLARVARGEPVAAFEPDRGARLGVLPLGAEGDGVRWFDIEPCFVFHVVNAWEEEDDDSIVLIACRRDEIRFGGMAPPDPGEGPANHMGDLPALHRFRLDLARGRVREERLDDAPSELPRIRDDRIGTANRFAWAARFRTDDARPMAEALVRYDLKRGSSVHHEHGAGCYGGEFQVVPRPGSQAEDDGYLLGFVHDEGAGQSSLRVLDAAHPERPPLACIALPRRVPYGFHAAWIPREEIGRVG